MKKNVFLAAAVALGTMLMATPVFAGNYGWNRDGRGWWYQLSNGSYVKSSWLSINGTWYSMDSAGYMETGWVRDGGGWYYMDTESGAMRVGWVNVNNNWYYMNPADGGRMLANGYTPDGYYVDGNGVYRPGVGTAQSGGQDSTQLSAEQFEDRVIELVNQERTQRGLRPLETDEYMTHTADVRVKELETLFSHNRPDGSSCFSAFPGEDSDELAENIASGQRTPEEVMEFWMNSPGHRKNILNPELTSIGVGYSNENGTPKWVQCFIRWLID